MWGVGKTTVKWSVNGRIVLRHIAIGLDYMGLGYTLTGDIRVHVMNGLNRGNWGLGTCGEWRYRTGKWSSAPTALLWQEEDGRLGRTGKIRKRPKPHHVTRAILEAADVAIPLEFSRDEVEARLRGEATNAAIPAGDERVYLIKGGSRVKIGTSINPIKRLKSMQTGSPVLLTMLGAVPGGCEREGGLHRRFASKRAHGEWFEDCPEIRAAFGVS
jgi:hypothetical protein